MSLPREVGKHPEDGAPIIAGIGRFGPYVKHHKTYANLEPGDDVLTIGLNRAVALIAEKKKNPGRGRRFASGPGRSLGEHPDKGGDVVVKNGRYGPYVSHDGINATLPTDKTPETITLNEAVMLLDARAERAGSPRRRKVVRAPMTRGTSKTKAAAKPGRRAATLASKSEPRSKSRAH